MAHLLEREQFVFIESTSQTEDAVEESMAMLRKLEFMSAYFLIIVIINLHNQ